MPEAAVTVRQGTTPWDVIVTAALCLAVLVVLVGAAMGLLAEAESLADAPWAWGRAESAPAEPPTPTHVGPPAATCGTPPGEFPSFVPCADLYDEDET